ncbi:hypothetical protein [Salinithrix halophila]|uniref:CcmD family protein n=1 Tax=Salinithrix halophila TaxID=1485204 RepID=A0ABV8JKC3_9BACL
MNALQFLPLMVMGLFYGGLFLFGVIVSWRLMKAHEKLAQSVSDLSERLGLEQKKDM